MKPYTIAPTVIRAPQIGFASKGRRPSRPPVVGEKVANLLIEDGGNLLLEDDGVILTEKQ